MRKRVYLAEVQTRAVVPRVVLVVSQLLVTTSSVQVGRDLLVGSLVRVVTITEVAEEISTITRAVGMTKRPEVTMKI